MAGESSSERLEAVPHHESATAPPGAPTAEEACQLLLARIPDFAILTLDAEGRLVSWNPGAERLFGYRADEILGKPFETFFTPEDVREGRPARELALAAQTGLASDEKWSVRKDGSRFWASGWTTVLRAPDGTLRGFVKIVRDLTECIRYEADLERPLAAELRARAESEAAHARLANILESLTDAFVALDHEWRFTYVNRVAEQLLKRSRQELLGRVAWEEFPEAVGSRFQREYERAVREQTPVHFVEFYPPLAAWFEVRADPTPDGLAIYFEDVSERLATEARLRARERQHAAVAELGQEALAGKPLELLMQQAAELVASTLDVELTVILERLADGRQLLLRAGVGWRPGLVGRATADAGPQSLGGYTLASDRPVVTEDLRRETRFTPWPLLQEHGAVSGMSVLLQARGEPWGVLAAFSRRPRRFTEDDLHFLQSMANVLSMAIERRRSEEEREALVGRLAEERRFLEAVVHQMPAGVVIAEAPSGRLIVGNEHVRRIWRQPLFPAESIADYQKWHGFHPDGQPYAPEEWPLARSLAKGEVVTGEEIEILRGDGTRGWVVASSAPIRREDGRIVAAVVTFIDITDRKREEETQRFLAEATAVLASSLEYRETLRGVAWMAVPFLADWCFVDVVEDDGSIMRLVVAHSDPARAELAEQLQRTYTVSPESPRGAMEVARTGQPLRLTEPTDANLAQLAPTDEYLRALRALKTRSVMSVPLSARGRVIGVLTFVTSRSNRIYDERDLALAQELARRAALALDNARLHEETETARRRLAFLARVSQSLVSTIEYEATIRTVGLLAVEQMADWCAIYLLDQFGNLQRVSVAASSPEREALAREIVDRYPADLTADRGIGKAIRRGEPVLVRQVTDALLREIARDAGELALLRRLGAVSAMVVPLIARGRLIGATLFLSGPSRRRYDPDDLALAGELATDAALAIDNAALFRQQREVATTLQRSLLPPSLPSLPGVRLAARYHAAYEGTEVGGDFYDCFVTDGAWALVIGDVSGKGVGAAYTAFTRYTTRTLALYERTPRRILSRLNEVLYSQPPAELFISVAFACLELDEGRPRVVVVSGGHPLPLVLRHDGGVTRLGRPGTVLGVFPTVELAEEATELAPGDVVLFYTDGVTEARSDGDIFGEERLIGLLRECVGSDAEEIAERGEAAVLEFQGGTSRDDIAILVVAAGA